MFSFANNLIETTIESSFRKLLIDWPMDFGVETAIMNGVSGDYHEFGVFKGRSFIRNSLNFLKNTNKANGKTMKFWAYDSFEGLPETHDVYAPGHFTKGSYSAPRELFMANVKKAGIDLDRVKVVQGFYDKTLTPELAKEAFSDRKVAMAYIDCDIYESAVPIFKYLSGGLQVGSVLVIDDWIRHHAHPRHGIQRAFNEWIEQNPRIKFMPVALTKRVAFIINEV